ncbi:MAG: magnesium chelatase [Peptococcaceae bacterium]|nr:magnesium chelatase [Peptococcaceae bacterium]
MHKSYHRLIRHSENEALFHAIELSILAASSPTPLHLHAEGLRGTGKTSVLRAAREITPKIMRISGCLYNCDPGSPHCPSHRGLNAEELAVIGTESISMPYLEISHSAKIATVVGSIDLNRLTDRNGPEAALLPGILAQAHRGIVLVDEINRLADTSPEIADVLLDVMGTKPGRLQIEETGLPLVELPLKVTVWAASNPDEDPGPLDGIRRQLSDRFDICVGVKRPSEISTLVDVLALSSEPYTGSLTTRPKDSANTLANREQAIGLVKVSQEMVNLVAKIYIDYALESLRAAESILFTARMNCAWRGALHADKEDIIVGVHMALRHRVSPEILADILSSLKQKVTPLFTPSSSGPLPEFKRENALDSIKSGSLFTRFFNAFKEPRADQLNQSSGQPGGPHVPDYIQPGLQNRRNVNDAARALSDISPEKIQMVAPPHVARGLAEIPYADRVRSEGDLL